jgi:hypothetical protein
LLGLVALQSCNQGPAQRRELIAFPRSSREAGRLTRRSSASVVATSADRRDVVPMPRENRYLGRAAMTNGIKICGGSGTDRPSFGGLRTVTQPTFVVMPIATRDSR